MSNPFLAYIPGQDIDPGLLSVNTLQLYEVPCCARMQEYQTIVWLSMAYECLSEVDPPIQAGGKARNIGLIYLERGDAHQALSNFERAHHHFSRMDKGWVSEVASTYHCTALVKLSQGIAVEDLDNIQAAFTLWRQYPKTGTFNERLYGHLTAAHICTVMGLTEKSAHYLKEANTLLHRMPEAPSSAAFKTHTLEKLIQLAFACECTDPAFHHHLHHTLVYQQ